jgi:hypothetical protein
MAPAYVALTTLTNRISCEELARVAAALQTQVTRDFAPEWGTGAVVAAMSFDAIPAGYVPLIVQDTLEAEGVNGFHRTRCDHTAYIVVPHGPNWSLAASHELLRMLANPEGSARRPGPSRIQAQGTVEYLIDVCAPCQDMSAAYAIDGVPVSDFCNQAFFGGQGRGGSFTGGLQVRFEPGASGIVTWLADDGLLYQARADHQGNVRVHGGFSPASPTRMLLRELVDMLTPDRLPRLVNAVRTSPLVDAEQNARRVRFANMARFREDIAWRFGHASRVPVEAMPSRESRYLNARASDNAKSGRQRVGEYKVSAAGSAS